QQVAAPTTAARNGALTMCDPPRSRDYDQTRNRGNRKGRREWLLSGCFRHNPPIAPPKSRGHQYLGAGSFPITLLIPQLLVSSAGVTFLDTFGFFTRAAG